MILKTYFALLIIHVFHIKPTTLQNYRRHLPQVNSLNDKNVIINILNRKPEYDNYKYRSIVASDNEIRRDAFSANIKDIQRGQDKARIVNKARQSIRSLNNGDDTNQGLITQSTWNTNFIEDPILNSMRRKGNKWIKVDLPELQMPQTSNETKGEDISSAQDNISWEKQWDDLWKRKQKQALEAKNHTGGDVINMGAARPWGVPCGDPNQHDMPWGTCVLPQECEAEGRIYRGDYMCGRTEFICCGYLLTAYDLDQARDYMSMEDKGVSADSVELRQTNKKKVSSKKKRAIARFQRKTAIRSNIMNIIKEISKLLTHMFKNSTKAATQKTKQMQKFVKRMKKKFKLDRKAIRDIHAEEMVTIDRKLYNKLKELRQMNRQFVNNATFRDMLINGTINQRGARMLVQAYPVMYKYIPKVLRNTDMLRPRRSRRSGRRSGIPKPVPELILDDDLDYDIEYGYLYY